MNKNTIAFVIALSFVGCASTAPAYASGTINLSLDASAYCATSQTGNAFSGVVQGTCQTPPGQCVNIPGLSRLLTSNIQYGAYIYPGAPTRFNVDVTEWSNIWGHRNSTDAYTPWPGVAGSGPSLLQFGRHNYLSAHFLTSGNTSLYGNFTYPESIPGPNVDIKISTICGDFAPPSTNPGCFISNAPSGGQVVMNWTFVSGNRSKCALLPNTNYYMNIKMHDASSPVDCSAYSVLCPLELALTFGHS